MMCGVYTRLMSVRESTSIELPSALSGSNVLMARPGVTSTRTVDWANAAVASTVNSNAIWADFRATFMVETKSDPHLEERNRDCVSRVTFVHRANHYRRSLPAVQTRPVRRKDDLVETGRHNEDRRADRNRPPASCGRDALLHVSVHCWADYHA